MNPLDIPSCPDEGILFWIHQTSPYPHTLTMDKGVYDNTVQCTLSLDPRMLFRILIINSHMKKKKTIYPIWLPARHRDVESFVTKHQLTRRGWINHWLICLTFTTATYQGQVHPPTHTLHKRAKWAGLTGRLLPYITCLQQYMFLLIKTELCLGGVCAAKEKKNWDVSLSIYLWKLWIAVKGGALKMTVLLMSIPELWFAVGVWVCDD